MNELPPPDPLIDALHHPGEREADRIIALLGHSTTPMSPPVGSRERLLARARREAQTPSTQTSSTLATPRVFRPTWSWLPLAAAAGLLVGALPAWHWYSEATAAARDRTQNLATMQDLRIQIDALRSEATGLRTHLATLQTDKAAMQAQARTQVADVTALQSQATALRDDAVHLRHALEAATGEIAALRTQVTLLRDEATQNEAALAILRSSKIQSFVLLPTADGKPGYARILWDQQNRRWHLRTEGLPVSAPGRTYELWFITSEQRKISAGTFDVDAKGAGTLLINLPPGLNDIAVTAVTDEPRGGSEQPTGTIHLAGKLP